jgi:DNA-binding GntR family transcriptional regulator
MSMPRPKQGNLEQQAYSGLLKMIIMMKIKPGEFLDERKLAAELGIGRTPVRAAISRLKLENFLEAQPNKSAYVKELSIGSVKDLIESIMIADKNAMSLAAKRINPALLKAMEKTQKLYEEAVEAANFWKIISLNLDFHIIIYEASRNSYLAQFHRLLRTQAERLSVMAASLDTPGQLTPSAEYYENVSRQHWEMIDCLKKRDQAHAEVIAIEHIELFKDRVLSYLRDTHAI